MCGAQTVWNREGSQCAGKAFWNPESAGEAFFLNPELPQSVAKLSAVIA